MLQCLQLAVELDAGAQTAWALAYLLLLLGCHDQPCLKAAAAAQRTEKLLRSVLRGSSSGS